MVGSIRVNPATLSDFLHSIWRRNMKRWLILGFPKELIQPPSIDLWSLVTMAILLMLELEVPCMNFTDCFGQIFDDLSGLFKTA